MRIPSVQRRNQALESLAVGFDSDETWMLPQGSDEIMPTLHSVALSSLDTVKTTKKMERYTF